MPHNRGLSTYTPQLLAQPLHTAMQNPIFAESNSLEYMKRLKLLFSALLICSLPVLGQQAENEITGSEYDIIKFDFSEDQIQQFAKASKALDRIHASNESRLIAAVEAHGLDVDEYNRQSNEYEALKEDEVAFKARNWTTFEAAKADVDRLRAEVEPQLTKAVKKAGLSLEEYQNMMLAFQIDPETQSRIYKALNALDRQ